MSDAHGEMGGKSGENVLMFRRFRKRNNRFRLCPFGVLAMLEFLLSQKQQTNAVCGEILYSLS
jgi:hypothetical protein